jgi:hypothetical protein
VNSILSVAGRNFRGLIGALPRFAMIPGASLADDASDGLSVERVAGQQPVEELQQLDEIWVRGQSLARTIETAEDKFFALYNKLNEDRRFDVSCGDIALSRDSMIMTRTCVPHFLVDYVTYYSPAPNPGVVNCNPVRGEDFVSSLGGGGGCNASGREVSPRSTSVSLLRRQDYANNVLTVIHGDPQLLEMAEDLARLYGELELTQRRYIKERPDRRSTTRPAVNPRAPL